MNFHKNRLIHWIAAVAIAMGALAPAVSQAVSLAMEGVDVGPDRLPRSVSQFPVVRRFFIDTEYRNPKVVSQAYELFRVVDEAKQ